MNITATSLTEHRIDIRFADYIASALNCSREITDETEFLFVTNGIVQVAKPEVLDAMKRLPSIYLIDDHTCWVPDLNEYPKCKILSQFVEHPLDKETPMQYFQVSKLALFDRRFNYIHGAENRKRKEMLYWGQYKEERHNEYVRHIPDGAHVVGRRYPEELSDNWTMLPFTKDLDNLNDTIAQYERCIVFGDEYHNGVNLPYRIYEALMNGCLPTISMDLLGEQELDIDWILDYITKTISLSWYKKRLDNVRDDIRIELFDAMNKHFRNFQLENSTEVRQSTDSVSEVLDQRATVYGSYYDGVECRAQIMEALNEKHVSTKHKPLPETVRVVFSDIILKLMRAASDPTHADSWLDLAGYTKLINEMFEENQYVFES